MYDSRETRTKDCHCGHRRSVPDRLSRSLLASVCASILAAGPIASCAEAEDPNDTPRPAMTSGTGGSEERGGEGGSTSASGGTTSKGGTGGSTSPNSGGESGSPPEPSTGGASGDTGAGGGGPECLTAIDCDDANV